MNSEDIIIWIQSFGCGFRAGLNGEFYIDWLDKDSLVHSTKGLNLKDAVIGAKIERDAMTAWELDPSSDASEIMVRLSRDGSNCFDTSTSDESPRYVHIRRTND